MLWLTWLLVTGLTFSFMAGIFHAYYTVALAPAIAALVGIGGWVLWQRRSTLVAAAVLSCATALTSVLGWILLDRSADFLPWLKWAVLVVGLGSAVAVAALGHLPRRLALAAAGIAVVASLAGPAAYAVRRRPPHSGSIPSAGPAVAGGRRRGWPGRVPGRRFGGRRARLRRRPRWRTGGAQGGGTGGNARWRLHRRHPVAAHRRGRGGGAGGLLER